MTDVVLTLNAGSSSLKFSAFTADERPRPLIRGQVASLGESPRFVASDAGGRSLEGPDLAGTGSLTHAECVAMILDWMRQGGLPAGRPVAAGHRVVHGGTRFSGPVRVGPEVLGALESLVTLAPLHQPHNLAAIKAIARINPDLPQVACFDTAFHSTQPSIARLYGIPRKYQESGIRGYGFHGLSYEHIAGLLSKVDPQAAAGRTVVAHLGHGASMCALLAGRSIATTMGFTALDGLVMGTRCGAIDPGVLLHLQKHAGLSVEDVERLLYEQSGLLGVSGVSADMRTLLQSEDPPAKEAVELFVYRAVRETGSLAAALGGLDAIVFTGGIGENSPAIRAGICDGAAWLGLELDERANTNARGTTLISKAGSRVRAWVMPADEELMITRHTIAILNHDPH